MTLVNLTPHPVNRKPAIVNLTPHPLVLRDEHGDARQTIPPSGRVARIAETSTLIGTLEIGAADVPWERKAYGTIEGLPEPEIYDAGPSMYYIVPLLTALAAKAAGRDVSDLLVPGQQTRDGDGTVNGCLTLASLGMSAEDCRACPERRSFNSRLGGHAWKGAARPEYKQIADANGICLECASFWVYAEQMQAQGFIASMPVPSGSPVSLGY